MGCINPDGTVTEAARELLRLLEGKPLTDRDVAARTLSGQPLYMIRSRLRELREAGLIEEEAGRFRITEKGRERVFLARASL
ncbi:MAG: hypothetical protein M0Z59_06640 [Nitrospiraceae bacterium]|nr:hypothetical protein [Nitrospiraceae bacterium]